MKMEGQRESENIEDRRGQGSGRGRTPLVVGGGLGTLLILILSAVFFGDPLALFQQGGGGPQGLPPDDPAGQVAPQDDELKHFVARVLADTEDVWQELFRKMGKEYRKPTLVLFRNETDSACGLAEKAVGPFYCPNDEKIYLDLAFFDELKQRFHSPGDFAQAYVIAHEVGHHVQKQLGTLTRVHRLQGEVDKTEANHLSVRLELQADFYAGVWAYHAQKMKHILDPGDLEEALRAATAIGDDRLQREARGYAVPDSFTHGTSAQRVRWFKKGFETGDLEQGDTFKARDL
jgi:predicted metalloprotease